MIFLDLGKRETGKTTLADYLVEASPVRVKFDPRGLLPTARRIEDRDQLKAAFDALYETRAGEIVVTPRRDVNGLFASCAREVSAYLTSEHPAHVGWLIDEVRFLDHPEDNDDLDWVLRCVRRNQANIVLTAHRPVDIATDIRAIADVWCIFAMTQQHDLDAIDDRCGPEVAKLARRLAPHTFVKWDDARGTYRIFDDPKVWYRPLRPEVDPRTEVDPIPSASGGGGERSVDTLF